MTRESEAAVILYGTRSPRLARELGGAVTSYGRIDVDVRNLNVERNIRIRSVDSRRVRLSGIAIQCYGYVEIVGRHGVEGRNLDRQWLI